MSDVDDLVKKAFARGNASVGKGGGGNRKEDFYTIVEGSNRLRILPGRKSEGVQEPWLVVAYIHYNLGPMGQGAARCIGEEFMSERGLPTADSPCPVCRKFLKLAGILNTQTRSDETKAAWVDAKNRYCPRIRYYCNVLTPAGEVKALSFGPAISEPLQSYWKDGEDSIGDFTDLKSGSVMNIKRRGQGLATKYDVRPSEVTDISAQWPELKKQLKNLDDIAGKAMTPDELRALMKGTTVKYADDDAAPAEKPEKVVRSQRDLSSEDDDDDDASDDDSEAPAEPVAVRKKKKKKLRIDAEG